MRPGSEPRDRNFNRLGGGGKTAPRYHWGEELTRAWPPMLDQTSWNRHELLKGWALSGKNPAPY
jgi:hypothetical protein